MKRIIGALIVLTCMPIAHGQGVGIGYNFDIGGSGYNIPSGEYNQIAFAMTHNGFIRFHNRKGNNALQFMVGFRYDSLAFRNRSEFLSPDRSTMMQYNTNASIIRNAMKFSVINQTQLGRPGHVVLSLNTGLFCEHTLKAARHGIDDSRSYALNEEINENAFGGILGLELRLAWFTIGYKYEQLFNDVLDHDYILSQELNLTNSSELRGLVMNPPMHFIYVGINLDFYHRPE